MMLLSCNAIDHVSDQYTLWHSHHVSSGNHQELYQYTLGHSYLLAGGWAATNYPISTRNGAQATLA
jgi:hypothetical protein